MMLQYVEKITPIIQADAPGVLDLPNASGRFKA
jgi:hypothetical protein